MESQNELNNTEASAGQIIDSGSSSKKKKKIVIILISAVIIIAGIFLIWMFTSINGDVYKTKALCEKITGVECSYMSCEYNCPKGAVKGWVPAQLSADNFGNKNIKCAGKGEFVNPENLKGKTEYPDECCSGLIGVQTYQVSESGECGTVEGTPYLTCVPCGDGVCEKIGQYFENICNCPEDCSQSVIKNDLLYKQWASWGPCANPDGGCWEREYLYLDGTYQAVTINGTSTKTLSAEAMKAIIKHIRTSGLLTAPCEYSPVLDLWKTYFLSLDGKENNITFPGCEEELDKLDDLILSTSDGVTKTDCEAAGGFWNPCGSPCSINVGNSGLLCEEECIPLCECGDKQNYSCPENFMCNRPEGAADARGYCVSSID